MENISVQRVVNELIWSGAFKATKYLSPNQIIRATRLTYKGRIDKRDPNIDIRLKLGRPNYAERQFIKDCKKSGVLFPVKRVQLKFFPKKK